MGRQTEAHLPDSPPPPPAAHAHTGRAAAKAPSKAERGRLQALSPQERFNGKDGRSGHAVIPHSYFTILPRKCGLGAAHLAVGYIMDRTFGAPGNPEWAAINCVQLARLAGDFSARAFSMALDEMAKAGIVKRRRPGCTSCDEGACDCPGNSWEYKTYPEDWASLPDRERPAPATAAPDEGDQIETGSASLAGAPAGPAERRAPGGTATRLLQPGATAKPVVLGVQIKDLPSPVEMRAQPTNRTPWPLLFTYNVSRDGTILEFIDTDPQWRTTGETGEVQFAPTNPTIENRRVTDAARLAEYRGYFAPIFHDELKKKLDEPFLRQIAEGARYAPPADFDPVLQDLRRRKLLTSSMIRKVAVDDVGAAWESRRTSVEKEQAEAATRKAGFDAHAAWVRAHEAWLDQEAARLRASLPAAELAAMTATFRDLTKQQYPKYALMSIGQRAALVESMLMAALRGGIKGFPSFEEWSATNSEAAHG